MTLRHPAAALGSQPAATISASRFYVLVRVKLACALAGLFCVAAVVLGVYAMAKKPASSKPKPAKSALVAPTVTN